VLLRRDAHHSGAVIAITQPCHGWVAGQLARAWGNDSFGSFAPHEEVCLAAEQHDLAWATWEHAPTLNAETGLPHAFSTLPLAERLTFWPGAAERLVLPQSRYAALLVSLHTTRLHASFDPDREVPSVAQALRALRDGEDAFRVGVLATLRHDSRYASAAADEVIDRNYRLLSTWDWLSLIFCGGVSESRVLTRVPTASGETDITVSPVDPSVAVVPGSASGESPTQRVQRVRLDPWPFSSASVHITWEGRRLNGAFADQQAMRAALARAPWITGETVLLAATD
jgi:hypothetical protein